MNLRQTRLAATQSAAPTIARLGAPGSNKNGRSTDNMSDAGSEIGSRVGSAASSRSSSLARTGGAARTSGTAGATTGSIRKKPVDVTERPRFNV